MKGNDDVLDLLEEDHRLQDLTFITVETLTFSTRSIRRKWENPERAERTVHVHLTRRRMIDYPVSGVQTFQGMSHHVQTFTTERVELYIHIHRCPTPLLKDVVIRSNAPGFAVEGKYQTTRAVRTLNIEK